MADILWKFNLLVKKIRGKDEFEMYKNYIHDLPFEKIAFCLNCVFDMECLKQKNDSRATDLRIQGNDAYKFREYQESLRLYTKSLRYANYNGKEYAVALANRSAALFALEDYKSSIDNINLCLKSKYPDELKPKVYIRKAKCFQKLGEVADMRKTLTDLLNYLESSKTLLKSTAEKYKKIVQHLITAPAENKSDPEDNFDIIPTLEANPKFLGASSLVMLKHNKRRGCHVVASKEIVRGDILFVEKAYAFTSFHHHRSAKQYSPLYCQYCLLKMTCSVPCRNCVKHLYCNEKCRGSAWEEFHQWECIGIQANFFNMSYGGYLALRTILKAVCAEISTDVINFKEGVVSYGNKDNNYPYVYNLPSDIRKMDKSQLMEIAAFAALTVNYLRMKTEFFEWMKQLPAYANKSSKALMNKLGGLLIRHCTQLQRSMVPVRVFDNASSPKLMSVANAICPSIAMMSHSCIPNTAFYFVGDTAIVKATKNIKINEDVSYSLNGNPFIGMDKAVRQELLQKLYYLTCSCQICSDPRKDIRDFYLCIICKGPAAPSHTGLFAIKECTCLDCNYQFVLPAEIAIKERLAYALYARFRQFRYIGDANKCLEMCQTTFTPYHSMFELLYKELMYYYTDTGNVECFIKFGKLLIQYVENRFDEVSLEPGMFCYLICLTLTDMLQRSPLYINFQRLGKILEELTYFAERARLVFTLHYPQFGARLQEVDKSIFEFRILHTLLIANAKLHNLI